MSIGFEKERRGIGGGEDKEDYIFEVKDMNLEDVKVEIIEDEKENVLKNMVSLYLHDLSEYADDLRINSEGKFEYGGLHYYFTEKDLIPFFIYWKNEIAGFVLLNSGKYVPEDAEFSIHEIFVLKSFRGMGVAFSAVSKIIKMYKGKYRVEQLKENTSAVKFWKSFYKKMNIDYVEKEEILDGYEVYVQLF